MAGIDANTFCCLHLDGADGSSSFPDASSYGHNFTAHSSDAKIRTAQSKFGGASLLTSTLTGAAGIFGDGSADLALGNGDFVIDFWHYPTQDNGSTALVDWGFLINGPTMPFFHVQGEQVSWQCNGALLITGTTLALNTWYHIAVVRSGGKSRMFYNGVKVGADYTDGFNYAVGANGPTIGGTMDGSAAAVGYVDEFRISKGTDRGWFNGFTPPSAPYSVASVTITGTLATTEAADTAAIAGTVAWPTITGTVVATEAPDVAAVAGTVAWPQITGTLATSEDTDTFAATGLVLSGIVGALAASEAADKAALTGQVTGNVGVLAATEAPDRASFTESENLGGVITQKYSVTARQSAPATWEAHA